MPMFLLHFLWVSLASWLLMPAVSPEKQLPYALAIHGGAGVILRAHLHPEQERDYRSALDSALTIGETILRNGGDALDAVEYTIRYLEDCPLFNAGRGAVFTHEGRNELDASIMDGRGMTAGAVGGVRTIRHPIALARAVMEQSEHVMLVGDGAEQFARLHGLDTVPASWFHTPERWEGLQRAKARASQPGMGSIARDDAKFGTVGCVALDQHGNLAAGTSTGGMTNKRWNRIGDAPIIGAGTYADNAHCAISCTGHGEFFIRYAVAHDVWALMAYKGWSLQKAAEHVVQRKLVEKGGEGGLIAVDRKGRIAMPFNSPGMYRGYARPGERQVAIFGATR
jgi:beta-aspartyl-peptidase (threonine type)